MLATLTQPPTSVGYPLQFGGRRRFGWQEQMAADLRDALAGLAVGSGDVLSEAYLSTDDRVTRRVADDGSCRPVWLAMKLAAAAGQIEVFGSALDGYRRSSE